VIATAHFSEQELIDLLQKKNREAYIYLYDRYAPALYGVIFKAVKNEKIAAHILERGFQKIWEQCHSLDCINQSLFIWMHSIVYKEMKATREVTIVEKTSRLQQLPEGLKLEQPVNY
jgi:DNA-directed RNA polymerase specialized sigma24 family protein